MKRVTIEGVEYYQWEAGEETMRRKFEEGVGANEALNAIVDALMKSWSKSRADHAEAWGSVREMINEIGGTLGDSQNMSYDWFKQRFKLVPVDKPKTWSDYKP